MDNRGRRKWKIQQSKFTAWKKTFETSKLHIKSLKIPEQYRGQGSIEGYDIPCYYFVVLITLNCINPRPCNLAQWQVGNYYIPHCSCADHMAAESWRLCSTSSWLLSWDNADNDRFVSFFTSFLHSFRSHFPLLTDPPIRSQLRYTFILDLSWDMEIGGNVATKYTEFK